ncbi:hypothetical protein HDU97_004920 [Phlyctochytrium planicorne]|nr:hypothetical protein HDU97_004920 [Phlyctochytrium planicorne]
MISADSTTPAAGTTLPLQQQQLLDDLTSMQAASYPSPPAPMLFNMLPQHLSTASSTSPDIIMASSTPASTSTCTSTIMSAKAFASYPGCCSCSCSTPNATPMLTPASAMISPTQTPQLEPSTLPQLFLSTLQMHSQETPTTVFMPQDLQLLRPHEQQQQHQAQQDIQMLQQARGNMTMPLTPLPILYIHPAPIVPSSTISAFSPSPSPSSTFHPQTPLVLLDNQLHQLQHLQSPIPIPVPVPVSMKRKLPTDFDTMFVATPPSPTPSTSTMQGNNSMVTTPSSLTSPHHSRQWQHHDHHHPSPSPSPSSIIQTPTTLSPTTPSIPTSTSTPTEEPTPKPPSKKPRQSTASTTKSPSPTPSTPSTPTISLTTALSQSPSQTHWLETILQRIPTSSPLYTCPFETCTITSPRRYNIITHVKTHMPKRLRRRDFECQICGCAYLRPYELERHVNKKHGGEGGEGSDVDEGAVKRSGVGKRSRRTMERKAKDKKNAKGGKRKMGSSAVVAMKEDEDEAVEGDGSMSDSD